MSTETLILNPEVATIINASSKPMNVKFVKVERKRMYKDTLKRVLNHDLQCTFDIEGRRWMPLVQTCRELIRYEQEYIRDETICVDSGFRTCQYKYPNNNHKYPSDKTHYFTYHTYHADYDISHLIADNYGYREPHISYRISIPNHIDANEYPYYGSYDDVDLIVCNECTEITPWPLFVPEDYVKQPIAKMFSTSRDYHDQWTDMELSISGTVSFEV